MRIGVLTSRDSEGSLPSKLWEFYCPPSEKSSWNADDAENNLLQSKSFNFISKSQKKIPTFLYVMKVEPSPKSTPLVERLS